MRYAIYFTPPRQHRLSMAAAQWLGRDIYQSVDNFENHQLTDLVRAPRRYGFHATLKAPFRLKDGTEEAALLRELDRFCAATQPVKIPNLSLKALGSFLALVPGSPSSDLNALAARIVENFEAFRAPLTTAEIERRKPALLSPAQRKLLRQWGYPYVFNEFRFHMTLTGRLADDQHAMAEAELQRRFGPFLGTELPVQQISVFLEREQGAPFELLKQARLTGTAS